ncbi:ABC transporter substrate-binding protein [Corynebacterium variabile]|uniref:ABC transporter substrate-binding protein n=1 Tax=Corynebacterium variabile TaxID=1727 RepID=UPI0028D0F7B5|nr:ABC transporter substrate-binding protein [Corynebacterium variabile]
MHLCGGGAPGRRGRRAVDGGTVRIGALTDLRPKTLYAAATTAEQSVSGLVFDTLTSYGTEDSTAALTPQPALAESWDVSGDGLTVTLHLRPGVLFHDSTPFTSDDVKASLTNYADPTHSRQLARTAALISEVDTSDPATAVLHLDRRVNNLFDLFDIIPVIDDKEVDAFNAGTGFNGTGAFRFGERHPGTSLDLPANEQYWGGPPRLDDAEIVVVPDERTLYSQLRSGQLDVVSDAGARDPEALEGNDLFRVLDRTGVDGNIYTGLNTRHPGLTDGRVRQAIGSAIDRDRILEEVFRGRERTTSLPWTTYSPAYDEVANEHYTRDTDRARQLLAEAGGAETIPEIPVSYTAGSGSEQNIAQFIAANLDEIGLCTRLDPPGERRDDRQAPRRHLRRPLGTGPQFRAVHPPSTLSVSAFPPQLGEERLQLPRRRLRHRRHRRHRRRQSRGPTIYRRLNNDLLEDAFILELVAQDSPLVTTSALHGVTWSKRSELDLAHAYLTE